MSTYALKENFVSEKFDLYILDSERNEECSSLLKLKLGQHCLQ